MDYTSRWKSFQFRSPAYLDGHFEPYEYDLVYWHEKDTCYTVGKLIWDNKEGAFDFESIGLRFLEHNVTGLNEWIFAFAKMKEIEILFEGDNE